MTKYIVLIGDGMSDLPLKQLGGKTPLEAAKTPNLDFLAQNGTCGWTNNVPVGMEPGSDVAATSIFGYNPKTAYTGRGPLEAASLGVKLRPDEIAFRCNLITIAGGKMKDFTAGHIATAEAARVFKKLNSGIGNSKIKFYPGLSYRNLLVIGEKEEKGLEKVLTIPPHDITGKKINSYLPKSNLLLQLMNESEVLCHDIKTKATMIWPWGQGKRPKLQAFKQKYGKKAAVITAVHLLKGLGKILGMEVINVPGATGYLDTNYKGKAEYAIRALKRNDVVFLHVEAPDEAGHEGDVKKKIKAIEDFDRLVVGTILLRITHYPLPITRLLVLPDHPTPIKYMTHTRDDVPFVVYDKGNSGIGSRGIAYNERAIKKSKLKIKDGYKLLGEFLGGKI
ncbi:MAG: cofactor-independent phosphoglycerate mutase [bacterium]